MDKVTQASAASAGEAAGEAGQLSQEAGNLLTAVGDLTAMVHGAEGRAAGGKPAGPAVTAVKQARKAPAAKAGQKALPAPKGRDDGFGF
jgi:type IV secretory pathway TrbL component